MNEAEITSYITSAFDGVHEVDAWGDTFFFYNPGRTAPDEVYFATLKNKDDEYDRASQLDRPSIFRLSIGVGTASYEALFGVRPSRHRANEATEAAHDFAALDQLLPHPVYAHLHWVCVLNPRAATFEQVKPLLAEAYALAVSKFEKRATRE